MNQFHPFHLIFLSPWPVVTGILILTVGFFFVLFLNKYTFMFIVYCSALLILSLFSWWRDVSRESTMQGYHTSYVFSNMRCGMLLFIISELFFFFSFFWSFFHSSLSPTSELGGFWPPPSMLSISPFDIPLLNTVILLSSGVTVTACHHFMINKLNLKSYWYLKLTILLGFYFMIAQLYEYYQTDFLLCDSTFGSCFFMATGFHGVHVMLGSFMLLFGSIRMKKNHFNMFHHLGLESGIWYWHFVDVVWLYLFLSVYWWVY